MKICYCTLTRKQIGHAFVRAITILEIKQKTVVFLHDNKLHKIQFRTGILLGWGLHGR